MTRHISSTLRGEQGEKSARELADSFQKLCGAIEVAMPPAAAVEGVINIGAQLYGRFARDYAAKTLGEGMQKLQPSIDETAVVLSHSLRQIEISLDAIRDQNAQNIEDEEIDGTKVSTRRHNVKMLTSRRADLLKMLGDGNAAHDVLRAGLLKAADRNRLTTEMALVHTVRGGLRDWAAAHSRLAAAALEKQPVQVEDLVQTALEIRDLAKTVRTP